MNAREKLIALILTAPPEKLKYIYELMLVYDINPEALTKPRTVRQ